MHCKKEKQQMLIVSQGLETIAMSSPQYRFLSSFLSKTFSSNVQDILHSMKDMTQYFYYKNAKPVAVLSFRKHGHLQCSQKPCPNMVYNVATAPYYRKRGYMKQLFLALFRDLKQQKQKFVHLEVLQNNLPAIALYKKLGFRVVEICEGIYHMRKQLFSKK